jgi:NTE family protein
MDLSTSKERAAAGGAALVLGSGGARGAYEVGVARFLFEDLHGHLGRPPDVRILCGTSAGALNALGLAVHADAMLSGVSYLWRKWSGLRLGEVMRADRLEVLALARTLLGCAPARCEPLQGRGGIIDPRPLRQHIFADLPLGKLEGHLREGRLEGLSFTATEVATGRTVLFLRRPPGGAAFPANRATVVLERDQLRPDHAFASAAIPLIFPPVAIDGRLYCDGSLRQSVPLSPALHLGAERIVVVSTQHTPPRLSPFLVRERESAATSPAYLLGKAINALTLDSIDEDLERVQAINDVIAAGSRAFGAGFLPALNQELRAGSGRQVRPVRAVLVRPSESLGRLAAEYVRGRTFHDGVGGALARVYARLADGESEHDADLLSYLLFDGPFAEQLMELGHADARAQRDQLAGLFAAPAGATAERAPAPARPRAARRARSSSR